MPAKDYQLRPSSPVSKADFFNGLVFGFDVGTASIGWAVRKANKFLDVGVLICPEETGKLDTRRGLRSGRRRLRNRARVRDWFAAQLEILGLPSPYVMAKDELSGEEKIQIHPKGHPCAGQPILKPGLDCGRLCNPVLLRCEAVQGRLEKPEELHVALMHLWKLKGKTNVPWKEGGEEKEVDDPKKQKDKEKEKKVIEAKLGRLAQAMRAGDGFEYPCQLLLFRRRLGIKCRDEVWPRDEFQNEDFNLKLEFLAIMEKQASRFPMLAGRVTYQDDENQDVSVSASDWLLYGSTSTVNRNGDKRRVYFKTTECENPGVLGLRWPRFGNRNPGLDLLTPFDAEGRPLHVVKRNKEVFRETQWEQALFNFRVIDKATGKKVLPDPASLSRLREIYESSKRTSKKAAKAKGALADGAKEVEIKVSESVLKKWAKEYEQRYQLIEDQTELISRTGDGRAKFSSATLANIKQVLETLSAGETMEAIQPLLREDGESKEAAMTRFLNDIRHGLVRHRLMLFLRLLRRLAKEHGQPPDFIVVEAVRTLAFSEKKKKELKTEQKKNRNKREQVFSKLRDEKQATSKDAILRYRLADETAFICPFCGETFEQAELYNGDVDLSHLYPQSLAPCNEFYNLTIAHPDCNRTDMENKVPREAFGSDPIWPTLERHARTRFRGKKLELFLAKTREDAEKLIESKTSLTATAYIAKMVRRLCLIELNWLGEDGRDPTNKEGNIPSKQFLVTNGEITARFRQAWELNELLHPAIRPVSDEEWNAMTSDQREEYKAARKKRFEKNRGDHRHHALDAMVIACTWPAYAQRVHNATKDWQDKGWWHLDRVKKRLMARHPLYPNHEPMKEAVAAWMDRVLRENRVQHHASLSKHKQAYKTSFFSQRPGSQLIPRNSAGRLNVSATPAGKSQGVLTLTSKSSEKTVELNQQEADEYQRLISEKGEAIAKSLAFNRELPCQISSRRKTELERVGTDKIEKHVYLLREKVVDVTPKDLRLRKVYPPTLSDYLFTAWSGYLSKLYRYVELTAEQFLRTLAPKANAKQAVADYQKRLEWSDFLRWLKDETHQPALAPEEAESRITLNPKSMPVFKKDAADGWTVVMPDREKLLKSMPEDFQQRLCFSHYQTWMEKRPAEFAFPLQVRIPIVRVRFRQPVNDNSVAFGPKSMPGYDGGHVYVKRGEIREVRLMPYTHGSGVVPVFVPYSKQDKPFSNYDFIADRQPLLTLRKKAIVRFAKDYSPAYPAGDYVVTVLGESVVKFILPHVTNTKEALLANGFPKSGLQAKWHLLIPALGFQFPTVSVMDSEDEDAEDPDET